jgi:hypothetical protein
MPKQAVKLSGESPAFAANAAFNLRGSQEDFDLMMKLPATARDAAFERIRKAAGKPRRGEER